MFLDSILTFLLGLSCILVGLSLSLEQLQAYFSRFSSQGFVKSMNKIFQYLSQTLQSIAPILGIFAVLLGFITFISPTANLEQAGDKMIYQTTRFFGDLIPSILSVLGGFMINKKVLDIFNISKEKVDEVQTKLSKYRVIIGLCALIFGFLHWVIGSSLLF